MGYDQGNADFWRLCACALVLFANLKTTDKQLFNQSGTGQIQVSEMNHDSK